MGISFVAAANSSHVFNTSLAKALPSGIADDDGVFAFVAYRGTLTPPSGWTLVTSSSATGSGITQILSLWRKDTVVAADSGASQTWSLGASDLIGVNYIVVRADSGVVVVRETDTFKLDATSTDIISVVELTTDRSDEIQLVAADTLYANNSSGFTPTPPLGTTLYSGTSLTGYRCMAARMDCSEGQYISGAFDVIANGTAGNAINTITARLSDQSDEVVVWDTLNITLTEDTAGATYNGVLSEGIEIHPLFGTLFQDALADAMTLTDTTAGVIVLLATAWDSFRVQGFPQPTWRPTATAADTINITPTLARSFGATLRDILGISQTLLPGWKHATALQDVVAIAEASNAGIPVAIADAVTVAATMQLASAVKVVERLGVTGILAPSATYGLTLEQSMRLTESLASFFGLSASDALEVGGSLATHYRGAASLTETIQITPTTNPSLILRVEMDESVEISSAEVLNAIYTQTVLEGVQIAAGYVAPDGNFTTWTMNTRTGAVTEYGSFVFNSFAQLGQKYLGAAGDGLYELNGDTDDGDDIIPRIKGGFMQFGGTQLSRLKAAYLATRGADDFVLKIETENAVYHYAVSTRSMRTTKVHMGKGQRARYFAYELIGSGGDFDLDTLEFVPLPVQRRV